MEYSHRYHAYPTREIAEELERHLNVHSCWWLDIFPEPSDLATTH